MNHQAVDILLVEDSESDAELTIIALRKNKLINKIHHVVDGEQALEFLFKEKEADSVVFPKVVLLDLKLPKVSGIEVLEKMKADEKLKNIPVVVLTSSDEGSDLEKCYDLGVNSYIVKPVDFDKFVEAVSNIGMYWLLLNKSPDNH
ncbi:MAG: response regulator [Bacteroidota bacterium]|nr:response regulator [Bacteroidota bacterium]